MEKWSPGHKLLLRCSEIPLQGETDVLVGGEMQIKENDGPGGIRQRDVFDNEYFFSLCQRHRALFRA